MDTFTFELTKSIKYAPGNGDEIEGTHIEISAPSGKVAHLVGILKSQIMKATKESLEGIDLSSIDDSKSKADSDEDDSYGEFAFTALTMGGADMEKVFVTFKGLLRKTAMIGGEKPFTEPMWDRMDYQDVENCLKAYIGNFMKAL